MGRISSPTKSINYPYGQLHSSINALPQRLPDISLASLYDVLFSPLHTDVGTQISVYKYEHVVPHHVPPSMFLWLSPVSYTL